MEYLNYILIALIFFLTGATFALIANKFIDLSKSKSQEKKADDMLVSAKKESSKLIDDSKRESSKIIDNSKRESREILEKARKESKEIIKKAEIVEKRMEDKEDKLEKRGEEILKKYESLIAQEEDIKIKYADIKKKEGDLSGKLSEIAKLSEEEAKELLLEQLSKKYESDSITQIQKYKKTLEDKKNIIAREILIKSMQQYAGDVTSEITTTIIPLQNDDLKGKLIGREGRNIVAFERATGVALIIDDTPDTVFISAFDLFKRYIAKKSLEKLLEDGRIQPARIEEIVENTTDEANILLRDIGKRALDELNINGIPEEIIPLIGKMRFRTSYGQNILKHSTEVAYIAESIAKDLKLDSNIAKIGGFLHDVGKSLDHDIEGTHPEIGAIIGRKYGLPEEIVEIIETHHDDPSGISVYTLVVQIADTISSVRTGARRESIEQYIKRVKEMEALVLSFPGVSKAYAISAGREVRVFVDANTISDLSAQELARDIALEIENKLNYPGEVKVNLIRELRVIEYAK